MRGRVSPVTLASVDAGLAHVIATLDETRLGAHVYDRGWRLAHATAAQRANVGAEPAIGAHVLSTLFTDALTSGGAISREDVGAYGSQLVPFIVATDPGGRAAVRAG